MNSVERHLSAETKAATLLAMRSAKKDVLLIVEGDTDVDLFANALGVPRSNILSCNGKEVLMLVYAMGPAKGIDPASIFIRDRDHDDVRTSLRHGILILVTSMYDIEMELLENRIFCRLLSDYLKVPLDQTRAGNEFSKICRPSAYLGALRLYSAVNSTGLDFDDIKYTRFIDQKTLQINAAEMIRYMFAKSEKSLPDREAVLRDIEGTITAYRIEEITCGKEFIDILSLALARHYNACPSSECSSEVLSRTIRIAANNEDIKMMPMYADLKNHINNGGLQWNGMPL